MSSLRTVLCIDGPLNRQSVSVRTDQQRFAAMRPPKLSVDHFDNRTHDEYSMHAETEVVWYEIVRWLDGWYALLGRPVQVGAQIQVPDQPDYPVSYAIGQTVSDMVVNHRVVPETIRIAVEPVKEGLRYRFSGMGIEPFSTPKGAEL